MLSRTRDRRRGGGGICPSESVAVRVASVPRPDAALEARVKEAGPCSSGRSSSRSSSSISPLTNEAEPSKRVAKPSKSGGGLDQLLIATGLGIADDYRP